MQPYAGDPTGIGHRLANLHAIGNIDKHRSVIITNVRWTGIDPVEIDRLSWSDQTGTGGKSFPTMASPLYGPKDLVYGQSLFPTNRLKDSVYLVIPIEAVFEEKDIEGEKWGDTLSVPEALDNCIAGVEMVVGHFKSALRHVAGQA